MQTLSDNKTRTQKTQLRFAKVLLQENKTLAGHACMSSWCSASYSNTVRPSFKKYTVHHKHVAYSPDSPRTTMKAPYTLSIVSE